MLKIRLKRVGRKKLPVYHIVVAPSQAPRDGFFVEQVGTYHPLEERSSVIEDRVRHWLQCGAQPTLRLKKILGQHGILPKFQPPKVSHKAVQAQN